MMLKVCVKSNLISYARICSGRTARESCVDYLVQRVLMATKNGSASDPLREGSDIAALVRRLATDALFEPALSQACPPSSNFTQPPSWTRWTMPPRRAGKTRVVDRSVRKQSTRKRWQLREVMVNHILSYDFLPVCASASSFPLLSCICGSTSASQISELSTTERKKLLVAPTCALT